MAVASLVAWLADDRATVDEVGELGKLLKKDVFENELRPFAEKQAERDPAFAEYGRAIAGHFWCDLLAETANALDRGAELLGKVPDEIKEAVLEHEDAAEWGPVRTELAKAAVGFLWKSLQRLMGIDPEALALQLRVLAVLICPDPGGHPRVARDCLRPLVQDTLREHLETNLEPEWLWGDQR
ncbi:hypothetical protein, partial [Nocardiopsis xinjiangensis]|uniref:hypothetical protein n=1 Tax=Nocardiopsis xinjiangensis TaxID=124285 RepID=UPI00037CCC26